MISIYIFSVFSLILASAQRQFTRSWHFDRWKDFTTNRDKNSWTPWDWSWYNAFDPKAPTPMLYEKWATHYMSHVIANLTGELYKDVEIKRKQGDLVRKKYEDLPGFKLGYIAQGVTERFKNMIDLFKMFSKYELWAKRNQKSISELLAGYQLMQSEYNELRYEKEVIIGIVSEFYSARPTMSKKKAQRTEGIKEGMPLDKWQSLSIAEKYQLLEDERRKRFIEGGHPERRYINESRMNGRRRVKITNEDVQEEYNKSLRHVKWLENWKGFNAEREGIENYPH